jgi:PEP-CTERM motif
MTYGCGAPNAVSFDNLIGNSIECNGVTFSNFGNFSSTGTNAPGEMEVVVETLIQSTAQTSLIAVSNQWIVANEQTINTSFTYSVSAVSPIDQVQASNPSYVEFGPGAVDSTVDVFSSTNNLITTIATTVADPIVSSTLTPPQSSLNISADLYLTSSDGSRAGTALLEQDFTLTAVPEPSTWAMILLGFVSLSFAGYRGSRKGAAAGA